MQALGGEPATVAKEVVMRLMAELLAASLAIGSGSMLGGCESENKYPETQYPQSQYTQTQYPQSQYTQGTYSQGQYLAPQTPPAYSPPTSNQGNVAPSYGENNPQGTLTPPDESQNQPEPVQPQGNQWS